MENNRNNPPVNNGDQDNQKRNRIVTIVIALIAALLFTTMSSYLFDSMTKKEITYNYFIELLDSNLVESVTFDSSKIYVVPKEDGTHLLKTTFWTTKLDDPELINDLKNKYSGVKFKAEQASTSTSILFILLQWILPLVVFWFLMMFLMKKATGGKGGGVFGVGKPP